MVKVKKIVFLIAIVLLLVAGGLFWWQEREIKGSSKDYVIRETDEGKIVENKRAGLTVKVPEGWVGEKVNLLEGSVIFDTPEIEGRIEDDIVKPPLKKGCGIESTVVYKKFNFDELKNEIKEMHAGLGIEAEEFEIITINNREALKNTFESKFIGPGTAIYFLNKNKLYSFGVYWAPDEKEKCVQAFSQFLETISIE